LGVLNRQGSLTDAPPEILALLQESLFFEQKSNGAFNIAVAPVVDLFSGSKLKNGQLALSPGELAHARELADTKAISLKNGGIQLAKSDMGLTFDGIAKGAIADEASKVLLGLGALHHLVNAGGDIYASGHRSDGGAWRVAVQNPSGGEYPTVCRLSGRAMATSGSYARYFDAERKYHHLIVPENGNSPLFFQSVSVQAPTAKLADALATALSVMPQQKAMAYVDCLPECAALFIDQKGLAKASRQWG
jgi:thiamine biosynthesis lipoprotein